MNPTFFETASDFRRWLEEHHGQARALGRLLPAALVSQGGGVVRHDAKKEETRRGRLATLIADSEQGRPVAPLTPPEKR